MRLFLGIVCLIVGISLIIEKLFGTDNANSATNLVLILIFSVVFYLGFFGVLSIFAWLLHAIRITTREGYEIAAIIAILPALVMAMYLSTV